MLNIVADRFSKAFLADVREALRLGAPYTGAAGCPQHPGAAVYHVGNGDLVSDMAADRTWLCEACIGDALGISKEQVGTRRAS